MSLINKVKSAAKKGLVLSRGILGRAQNTATNLGQLGQLKIDIKEINNRIRNEETRLGHRIHELFSTGERQSVSVKTPGIKDILEKIDGLHAELTQKQASLKKYDHE